MSRGWKLRSWMPLLAALALVLAVQGLAVACPSCKEALDSSDPQRQNLVRGYFYSILFMLSMPFILFTSLSAYFYYEVCKARRQRAGKPVVTPGMSGMRQMPTS